MKHLNLLLSAATAVALTLPHAAQSQTVLDLLKTLQPGQSVPAQPAPPPTVVTNTQTIIIYSNTPVQTAQAAPSAPPAPPAVFDTRPAFMAMVTNYVSVTNPVIVTNYVVPKTSVQRRLQPFNVTNPVIVTNYVVSTRAVIVTNFYNAQGQYLQPVQPVAPPPIPGLIPIAPVTPAAPKPPAGPDPKVVRANQLQAVKDLLTQSATTTSKNLSAAGSFNNSPNQIQIPEGMTVFDRAKATRLLTAMNTAAEKAVPEVSQLVQAAIARLDPADPLVILKGGPDAATKLLLTIEGQNLANQSLPIVKRAGVAAGLPDAYQNAMLKGGGLLGGLLGGGTSVDIDSHVTRGVLAAIVNSITAQEGMIRSTPSARNTTALQNAFK